MNILAKRVEELELKILKKDDGGAKAVFCRIIDARKEAPPIEEQLKQPVKGWHMGNLKVLRAEGETDEELEQRATKEAMPLLNHPLARPVFHEIMDYESDQ